MALGTAVTQFGERLRNARAHVGLTLEELASETGLSKAHLSRLESGERQPSLAALVYLARTLGVPISQLLGEADGHPQLLISTGQAPRHEVNGLSIATRSGFPGSSAIEVLNVLIAPEREPSAPARHQGEEWLYVLHGTLLLELDDEPHIVREGESVHFDALLAHRLAAVGETCEVLVVAGKDSRSLHALHH